MRSDNCHFNYDLGTLSSITGYIFYPDGVAVTMLVFVWAIYWSYEIKSISLLKLSVLGATVMLNILSVFSYISGLPNCDDQTRYLPNYNILLVIATASICGRYPKRIF